MGDHGTGDVGLAFALTIGAGAASAIGGAVVFRKRLVHLASHRVLAASLAVSAGVMLYVSFVELLAEGVNEFAVSFPEHGTAVTLATLCFFLGIAFTAGLGRLVHMLDGDHTHDAAKQLQGLSSVPERDTDDGGATFVPTLATSTGTGADTGVGVASAGTSGAPGAPGDACDVEMGGAAPSGSCGSSESSAGSGGGGSGDPAPVAKLAVDTIAALGRGASELCPSDGEDSGVDAPDVEVALAAAPAAAVGGAGAGAGAGAPARATATAAALRAEEQARASLVSTVARASSSIASTTAGRGVSAHTAEKDVPVPDAAARKRLRRMGLLTALAIGVHNVPEGLTTFVATLASPTVGAALAVAIAIHNIPEGVCVAVPIYYATGKRWPAFMWSLLAAVAEPFGALLGYAVIAASASSDGTVHPNVYGALFAVVAGIMVFICVQELIPMALQYDAGNQITTKCIFAGMLIMAVSLVLFDWA